MRDMICFLGLLVWGWGLLFLILAVFYLVPAWMVAWMVGWV